MPAIVLHRVASPTAQELNNKLAQYLSTLDAHASTKWFYSVTPEPLDIAPGPEADALIARIFERLKDTVGAQGHSANGSTYEKLPLKAMMVWAATSDRLATKFSLVNWESNLYVFVSGDSNGIDDGLDPWLDALGYALSNVNMNPTHAWHALIGMEGDMHGMYRRMPVANFGNAGMSASPTDFEYEEAMPYEFSLGTHRQVRWQPFVVTGSATGHNWHAAEANVRADLHLLCALLSAQTLRLWKLRQRPNSSMYGSLSLPSSGTLRRVAHKDAEPATESTALAELQLHQLWDACIADPDAADIARAYYEAVQMSEHPSFALIGFVGVIEAVGAKLFPPRATEKCESCGKPKTNSAAKRFRDALSLVLAPDRVKVVSERLYKWRSGTAHAGRLHARETSFGYVNMSESMLAENKPSLFEARGRSHAQEIARDLLLYLLEKRPILPPQAACQTA